MAAYPCDVLRPLPDSTFSETMKNVKFLPWVGQNYASGFNSQRTLILGESHYQWDCEQNINDWRTITQVLVQEQCDGAYTKAFWTKIAISFLGHRPTLLEKREFWSSVAFYNFVQESAGDGPRIAPAKDSWASSEDAFTQVLQALEPKFVLILGDRLSGNLSRFLKRRGKDIEGAERVATFRIPIGQDSSCLAYPIKHPSTGFDGRTWAPHITTAMKQC